MSYEIHIVVAQGVYCLMSLTVCYCAFKLCFIESVGLLLSCVDSYRLGLRGYSYATLRYHDTDFSIRIYFSPLQETEE